MSGQNQTSLDAQVKIVAINLPFLGLTSNVRLVALESLGYSR